MKKGLALLLVLLPYWGCAQISVDTSKGNVIIKEKTPTVYKSLSIYRTFVPFRGMCSTVVYDPNAGDYGDDPDSLYLNFSVEQVHVKNMLAAALKYKKYDFYRFAFDIAPYSDLVSKLVDIYANSPQWNEYLKKAGNMLVSDTLFDGNEITEIKYDAAIAAGILEKSDFVQVLNDFFLQYGYRVKANGFPIDHQPVVSKNELRSLGRPETLFIPIPNGYFTLTKIK